MVYDSGGGLMGVAYAQRHHYCKYGYVKTQQG
jgi:hypothetical protein